MQTSQAPRGGRRARIAIWVLVLAAGLVGALLVVVGLINQQPEPPELEQPVGSTQSSAAPQRDSSPPAVTAADEPAAGREPTGHPSGTATATSPG